MTTVHDMKQNYSLFVRFHTIFGIVALVLFVVVGCGGPKQLIVHEKSRESGPPAWLTQAVTHPEYLYFTGIADRAKTLKEGRDQARQDAANQASSYIGIRISTETFIQDSTEQSSTIVDEQTRSSTDASISFLEVTDEYYVKTNRTAGNFYEEKYAVYVLCRFPKASARKEKKRQTETAQRDGALARAISNHAFELNPGMQATRFILTATISLHQGKQIWNQFQYVSGYTYRIKDRWTANTITGGSGESKAFARSKEVAAQNAVAESATDIGLAAGSISIPISLQNKNDRLSRRSGTVVSYKIVPTMLLWMFLFMRGSRHNVPQFGSHRD